MLNNLRQYYSSFLPLMFLTLTYYEFDIIYHVFFIVVHYNLIEHKHLKFINLIFILLCLDNLNNYYILKCIISVFSWSNMSYAMNKNEEKKNSPRKKNQNYRDECSSTYQNDFGKTYSNETHANTKIKYQHVPYGGDYKLRHTGSKSIHDFTDKNVKDLHYNSINEKYYDDIRIKDNNGIRRDAINGVVSSGEYISTNVAFGRPITPLGITKSFAGGIVSGWIGVNKSDIIKQTTDTLINFTKKS